MPTLKLQRGEVPRSSDVQRGYCRTHRCARDSEIRDRSILKRTSTRRGARFIPEVVSALFVDECASRLGSTRVVLLACLESHTLREQFDELLAEPTVVVGRKNGESPVKVRR